MLLIDVWQYSQCTPHVMSVFAAVACEMRKVLQQLLAPTAKVSDKEKERFTLKQFRGGCRFSKALPLLLIVLKQPEHALQCMLGDASIGSKDCSGSEVCRISSAWSVWGCSYNGIVQWHLAAGAG